MVYTITFNPAIDYTVTLNRLYTGRVNRCLSEQVTFGGKGVNVSAVLKELGVPTKALGFCAGFTGQAIVQLLEASGVATDFVDLTNKTSRINVKIIADEETEINGAGPDISEADLQQLFEKLSALENGDIIVLAGSVPASVPRDIYCEILSRLSEKSVLAAVDAEGELLLNVLKYRPFVIKPNLDELEQIFASRPKSEAQVSEYAWQLKQKGAVNVLVSMGPDGSLLLDEHGKVHKAGVCKGTVVSSVGAGDSMLAGFIAGYEQTKDYDYALRLGTACGGAAAFSGGVAKAPLIGKLLDQL